MSELLYSKKSHRKIVHYPHCKILRRISKENRCSFTNFEQAQDQGYRLCNCCPPVAQKYRKEQVDIKAICRDTDLTCLLQDNVILVFSKYDCWRIIAGGKNNKLFLYHKNTKARRTVRSYPIDIAGYHPQPCRYNTIVEYLGYIRSHDQYREKPRTTKKRLYQDAEQEVPEWMIWKYGEEYFSSGEPTYKRKKGTKAYKKEQKKRKRENRRVSIDRVTALLERIAVNS